VLEEIDDFESIEFEYNDIVRSEFVKKFIIKCDEKGII
jgi:phosphate starvation-inducible protein PhoH